MNMKETDNKSTNQKPPLDIFEAETLDIAIIGSGFNGLETAYKALRAGHTVTVNDIDEERVQSLNQGSLPIQRPGWQEEFDMGLSQGKLSFTTKVEDIAGEKQILFVCVNPVPAEESLDLSPILMALDEVENCINKFKISAIKSWLPLGFIKSLQKKYTEANFVVNLPHYNLGGFGTPAENVEVVWITNWWEKAIMEKVYSSGKRSDSSVLALDREAALAAGYSLSLLNETVKKIDNFCANRGTDVENIGQVLNAYFTADDSDYYMPEPENLLEWKTDSEKKERYEDYLTLQDLTSVFDRSYGRLAHWISEVDLGNYSKQEFEHRFSRKALKSFIDNELRSTGWFDETELSIFKERVDKKFREKISS